MTSGSTAPEKPSILKALLVEDDTHVAMGLKSHLEALGVQVCAHAANAQEAHKLFSLYEPDLILMDVRLGNDDGLSLAAELLAQRRCSIVVVSAHADSDLISRAGQVGVFGYLIKPVTREALAAQVEVAMQRFREAQRLVEEKRQLTQTLETRKLMDRAKGILMKRQNMDEPSAHRRLQQESQRRRIAMPELCRKVIESEDLLGGSGT